MLKRDQNIKIFKNMVDQDDQVYQVYQVETVKKSRGRPRKEKVPKPVKEPKPEKAPKLPKDPNAPETRGRPRKEKKDDEVKTPGKRGRKPLNDEERLQRSKILLEPMRITSALWYQANREAHLIYMRQKNSEKREVKKAIQELSAIEVGDDII